MKRGQYLHEVMAGSFISGRNCGELPETQQCAHHLLAQQQKYSTGLHFFLDGVDGVKYAQGTETKDAFCEDVHAAVQLPGAQPGPHTTQPAHYFSHLHLLLPRAPSKQCSFELLGVSPLPLWKMTAFILFLQAGESISG